MKRTTRIFIGAVWIFAFTVWTLSVSLVDLEAIGPNGSFVGFASLNGYVHKLTGVNLTLYTVTDWLGLVPIAVALTFATLGLLQWIKRKSISKVDKNIILLGGFYLFVMAAYLLFEGVVINYRPILINGRLEPSYPSSTTMLVTCVMPTAVMQLRRRIKNKNLKRAIISIILAFTVFTVIGRLICGVHWFSDIVGGLLLSIGMVTIYQAIAF